MFFKNQDQKQQQRYEKLLKIICSLSKLNSQNDIPYLYYRMAENIFCEAFEAINLSRNDISIDAKKSNIGIGLKTFICKNSNSLEKIAEFNKDLSLFDNKKDEEICKIISSLRNNRLDFACKSANVDEDKLFYHCISRDKNLLFYHEEKMVKIQIDNINSIKSKKNTIFFNDGIHEYSFNKSKNTLFKRFQIKKIHHLKINIIENPFNFLENLFIEQAQTNTNPIINSIVLPLYSPSSKEIPLYSGLNQWNAKGRKRDQNEIYIPIPAIIHRLFKDFFPPRDSSFSLKLPSGIFLNTKVCQDNSKALMSNPNKALGNWLLREVLNIPKGNLITYSNLQSVGIDSVQINKFQDNSYEILFKKIGSYEQFIQKFTSI